MFLKPKTVDSAIASLSKAHDDLIAVSIALADTCVRKREESDRLSAEADEAGGEALRAQRIAERVKALVS